MVRILPDPVNRYRTLSKRQCHWTSYTENSFKWTELLSTELYVVPNPHVAHNKREIHKLKLFLAFPDIERTFDITKES